MLETPDGPLTESSAIARYLASLSPKQALYPQPDDPSDTTRALIDAWIDWATVLDKATKEWVEPMFGEGSQQQAALDAAKADFEKALQTLNMHLGTRTYLVGDTVTLADLVVVSHLLLLYLTVRFTRTTQISSPPHHPHPPKKPHPFCFTETCLSALCGPNQSSPEMKHMHAVCYLSCNGVLLQGLSLKALDLDADVWLRASASPALYHPFLP